MSTNIFQAGDRVIIDPVVANKDMKGRVFEVVRRLKVNYDVKPLDGVGSLVRAQPEVLLPAPAELLAKPIVAVAPLSTGSTVRVKRARNIDPTTLFVVLADGAKVKIAELGGEDGRYWNVPRSALEKVTIDLVAATASAQVVEV
ncbi:MULTISPECIES: hypothetical protein [unclassified Rhodococcus (in: high G+C Gram-positive bacteria)]|uniref:hypothetical protein n=1 Tax=unclassified Rhodococcus (in: high G+C Gram-positive bacteria) TaxID=192944 RepID=UPI001639842A|nr:MULTISPECIES: hypothetical protein [unclassified Rhodococcus (in: high G+C Gram-positive bacteria)]MBC2637498.1 hypothetical protein [Rhodococcus sp. 3A]MBC2898410.1 hypothetical protein [Rhodococcus sp. 4CII]